MKRNFVLAVFASAALLAFVAAGPLFSQESPAPQDMSAPGVLVAAVAPGSPAEKAGIQAGDRILSVDNQNVVAPVDVVRAVRSHKAGDQVELSVMSDDNERTLTIVPDDRNGRPYIGVSLRPSLAQRDERPWFGPEGVSGAMILQVAKGSPAEQAGLKPHDMIVSVDGEEVQGQQALADLIGQHKVGDTVTLDVRSPYQDQREVEVTLKANPENSANAWLGVQYVAVPAGMQRNPFDSDHRRGQGQAGPSNPL